MYDIAIGQLVCYELLYWKNALVEISSISHFNLDHDRMVEKRDVFWMKTENLILDDQQQQEALMRNKSRIVYRDDY